MAIGKLTQGHHASILHSIKYVEDYSLFDKTYNLYKESIDSKVLVSSVTKREEIYKILSSTKNKEFKCNAILALMKKENESFNSIQQGV